MNQAESKALLQTRGVTKSYQLGRKQVAVLHGVDLQVRDGDFLAIKGASGAGKSTLLHLLGGLDRPDTGTVEFGGKQLTEMSRKTLARFRNSQIGFVFQAYHLFPEMDALENVCLPARISHQPMESTESKARKLLEKVGLGQRMDHRPYELSGGEQQRVAIARALINEPNLLLADEPTGNLDSVTGEEITSLLISIQSEFSVSMVMATHDQQVAARASRMVELIDGVIRQ